jgi:hypothetical protein
VTAEGLELSSSNPTMLVNYQSFFTLAVSSVLFTTGPIGTSVLTGTAIWANQSSAIRITSEDQSIWRVTDIAIEIKTLYVEENNKITVSLCNEVLENEGVPDLEDCLDSSKWQVLHPGARVYTLNWDLDKAVELDFKLSTAYWIVLENKSDSGEFICYCRPSKVRKSFFSSIRCLRTWETSTANSP